MLPSGGRGGSKGHPLPQLVENVDEGYPVTGCAGEYS